MRARAVGLVPRLATAVATCWLVTACEKADTAPGPAASAFGVPLAAFPATSDVLAACEFAADGPDRLRRMIAERLPDPTPRCGFNPIDRVRAVVVGGDQASGETVFAIRGITRRDFSQCFEKLGNRPREHGPLTSLEVDGKTEWIGWLAGDVFIAGFGRDRAYVERHLALDRPLRPGARLVEMLEPRPGAQCAFAITSPALAGMLGPGFEGLASLRGSLHDALDDEGAGDPATPLIELTAALRFATAGQAERASQAIPRFIREQGPSLGPAAPLAGFLADLARVKRTGSDVSVTLAMDRAGALRLANAMR